MSVESRCHERAVQLVEVRRGGVVECAHWGHVVVALTTGETIVEWGDAGRCCPGRGVLAPYQVLPLVLDGIDEKRTISPLELAVAVGGHAGTDLHQEAVRALLRRALVSPDHLQCARSRAAQARVADPCSGKHAALLAYTQAHGADLASYTKVEAPVQQRILSELLKLTKLLRSQVPVVEDSCHAPVACLPLGRLAQLWAYLSDPITAGAQTGAALTRLVTAIHEHPEALEGDGLFDTELSRSTNGEVLVRTGAAGLVCAAIRPHRLGVVVKLESGDTDLARGHLLRTLVHLEIVPARALEVYAASLRRARHRGEDIGLEFRVVE